MKKAWLLAVLVAGCASMTACKGGGAEMVKAQEGFADEACACKELPCVQEVQKKQAAWIKEHGGAAVGDESDYEKIEAANKKLTDCVTKVAQAVSGGG